MSQIMGKFPNQMPHNTGLLSCSILRTSTRVYYGFMSAHGNKGFQRSTYVYTQAHTVYVPVEQAIAGIG